MGNASSDTQLLGTSRPFETKPADSPLGFRVLGVHSNSPACYTGLVAFFDFIVAANNVPLRTLDTTFIGIIQAFEEKPLTLTIYNCKNHSTREVVLVPSKNWPGEGMLGVTIRFDSYKDAEEHVIHVLEVEPNSPADIAGLKPMTDYLLGTAEKAFVDSDVLFQELKSNIDHPLEVYVYNSETDEVRIVVIMPTTSWGGEGILGASVANGFLHALPSTCCNTIGKSVDNPNNSAIHSPFGSNQVNPSVPMISPITTAPSSSAPPPMAPKVANYDAESAGMTTDSSNSGSEQQPIPPVPTQQQQAQPTTTTINPPPHNTLPPQSPMPLTGPPGNVKNLPPINFRYSFLNHVDGDSGLFGNFRREPEELMRTIEAASQVADIR